LKKSLGFLMDPLDSFLKKSWSRTSLPRLERFEEIATVRPRTRA